jgi:hypothetical protein
LEAGALGLGLSALTTWTCVSVAVLFAYLAEETIFRSRHTDVVDCTFAGKGWAVAFMTGIYAFILFGYFA